MSRSYTIAVLLVILVMALATIADAAGTLSLPTWPQTFTIAAGEQARFAFPVTQAGDVKADIKLRAGGVKASLLDIAGKPVLGPVAVNAPGGQATRTFTAQDLQRGVIWIVLVENPGRAPVEGQVTVTYPSPDLNLVTSAANMLKTRPLVRAKPAEMQPVPKTASIAGPPKSPVAGASSLDKGVAARIAKLNADLLKRMKPVDAKPITPAVATGPILPGGVRPQKVELAPEPAFVLSSVTPNAAMPGQVINLSLTGTGFNGSCRVHLDVNGQDLPLNTYYKSATLIEASMAFAQCDLNQDTNATLYVTGTNKEGKVEKSEPLPFLAQQNVPHIASLDRTSGICGEQVLISGSGFYGPLQYVYMTPVGWTTKQLNAIADPANGGGNLTVFDNYMANVVQSNRNQVLFKIPEGIPVPINGLDVDLTIKTGLNTRTFTSNVVRFHLNPIMEERSGHDWYYPIECVSFDKKEGDDRWGEWCPMDLHWGGRHVCGTFSGHRGDDYWAITKPLINGWKVKRIHFEPKTLSQGNCSASAPYTNGSGCMETKVHWWLDWPTGEVSYRIDFILEGPRGVRSTNW